MTYAQVLAAIKNKTPIENPSEEVQQWRQAINFKIATLAVSTRAFYAMSPKNTPEEFVQYVTANFPKTAHLIFALHDGAELYSLICDYIKDLE